MSFPRYPKYKDSGVEWFCQIPEHWAVKRLKGLVDPDRSITYGIVQAGPEVADGVPYIRPVDMTNEGGVSNPDLILRTSNEIAESYRRSTILAGDLVVSIGPSFGKVMIVPGWLNGGNLTQGTARVAIASAHPSYIFWTLRAPSSFAQWESSVGGATFRALNLGPLAETCCPEPPRAEQEVIAHFLNEETAKIDALVAEQEQLISLLKEKRQAVISQAVTKGLDPSVPMKDSGVEWLGSVPQHWRIARLGGLFSEIDERGSDDLPVLSVSIHHGVSDSELDESELDRKVTRSEDRSKYKKVIPHDLVYNMMRAWQGGFGTVEVEGMVSPAYVVARPRSDTPTFFVEQMLRTAPAVEEMRRHSRGVTDFRLRLYWEEFKNLIVAVPTTDEATRICNYIKGEVERFDSVVDAAHSLISQLAERRSALISATVTGQIDVRSL